MRQRRSLFENLKLLLAIFKAKVDAGELNTVQGQVLERHRVRLERAIRAHSYEKVLNAVDDLARDLLRFVR